MNTEPVYTALAAAIPLLSDEWKEKYGLFLAEEHLRTFAARLAVYQTEGVPQTPPAPHFTEEVTPPPDESFRFFEELGEKDAGDVAGLLENTPFNHLLLLMGQRLTPASLQNEQAIPPLRETLWQSCFTPYNTQTSVAVRAWEKHVGRSADAFWGEVKGSPEEKERTVQHIIRQMFENQTWWNMFYHYKHETVYEIRVPGGHGMRWTQDGKTFIGFLEPFL